MKKNYISPDITVIRIGLADIIAASVYYIEQFGCDDCAEDIF
jgi:hypothetical protein